MTYRLLRAEDAFWRESNQMRVLNTDLAKQLEARGRIRVDDAALELAPLDALLVEPDSVRQVFNDTDEDALWLVVGAPPEGANTLEMSEETLRSLYPEGPRALPPELGGGELRPPPAAEPG